MFVPVSIFDPLEQFGVINYCSYSSNVSTFALAVLFIIFFFLNNFPDVYLMRYKNFFIKKVFNFVRLIVNSNILIKKRYMFFLVLLIFMYILLSNIVGLIPYTFTVTSSLAVTFFIASMFFIGVNIISIFTNG
jgi:F-type H+-transporting ATPase subunit a